MQFEFWGLQVSLGRARQPVHATDPIPVELDAYDRETIAAASEYTMTTVARLAALIKSVRYVCENSIAGDIVECGVWKGGSMMSVARTLKRSGDESRMLYLYDTFEGMPPPGELDKRAIDGAHAAGLMETDRSKEQHIRAIGPLEVVKQAMSSTGYPAPLIKYIKGKVENTIPGVTPAKIALLRLDTDWYESTRHELEHLYDRLVPGGVLIVDDFGYWEGARRAVEEFFARTRPRPLLSVIDETGRIAIKPGSIERD